MFSLTFSLSFAAFKWDLLGLGFVSGNVLIRKLIMLKIAWNPNILFAFFLHLIHS